MDMKSHTQMALEYRVKALAFLRKYEEAQRQVDADEAGALAGARARQATRIRSRGAAQADNTKYDAADLLKDDFQYKAKCAQRNGYQLAANTYFLAAIALGMDLDG